MSPIRGWDDGDDGDDVLGSVMYPKCDSSFVALHCQIAKINENERV